MWENDGTYSATSEDSQAESVQNIMSALPFDAAESAQMTPFQPGTANGMQWWESVIAYGATRAIDNRFGPVNVLGNTNPGTFAGQNGRTYGNTTARAPGPAVQVNAGGQGFGLLALLGVAAAMLMG